jgi:large subunit ribosomal protein L4
MLKANVYDIEGKQLDSIELKPEVFGVEPHKSLVHASVVAYLKNQRQGTSNTKNRALIEGGGAKPWRQKGTGRARSGSNLSPVWRGGAVTFGPHPRNFRYNMNRKMKRIACISVLSDKVKENNLLIVDNFSFETPKTKEALRVLKNLDIANETAMIIVSGRDENTYYSFRNIKGVCVRRVENINVYEMLKHNKLVITKEALTKIEEVMS